MNCKWCNKELTDVQKYGFARGKLKGNSCSRTCSQLIRCHGSKEKLKEKTLSICIVCKKQFQRKLFSGGMVCSIKCQGILSSKRMKLKNPMDCPEIRKKASDRLKEINHKPIIQGGNGRKASIHQLNLYNELIKVDNSFEMELIEKTGDFRFKFKSPRHYKIDIGSRIHKIAIEVDGSSHNTLKVKECDERKTQLLNLKGWKVLRLSNYQIKTELMICVQKVLSMI